MRSWPSIVIGEQRLVYFYANLLVFFFFGNRGHDFSGRESKNRDLEDGRSRFMNNVIRSLDPRCRHESPRENCKKSIMVLVARLCLIKRSYT